MKQLYNNKLEARCKSGPKGNPNIERYEDSNFNNFIYSDINK